MGEHEDRLGNLEAALQGLKLVNSGISVAAKFPPIPEDTSKLSLHERLSALEKAHKEFRIVGGDNVTVAGSLKTGYAICSTCPGEDQGTSGAQLNFTPTINGACCFEDGSCSVTSSAACANAGGTYQGDGTDCDPNPCVPCETCPVMKITTTLSTGSYNGAFEPDPGFCEMVWDETTFCVSPFLFTFSDEGTCTGELIVSHEIDIGLLCYDVEGNPTPGPLASLNLQVATYAADPDCFNPLADTYDVTALWIMGPATPSGCCPEVSFSSGRTGLTGDQTFDDTSTGFLNVTITVTIEFTDDLC